MIPFKVDLNNRTAVITGGAGVLGSVFAKAMAECGAKVAILDLRKDAADVIAREIVGNGHVSAGFECNVLDLDSLYSARDALVSAFGRPDILINGAGGNHPGGTTTKDHFDVGDMENESVRTFYDLEPESVQSVFNLNFIGTLLPTQVFSKEMLNSAKPTILNISSMSAFTPLTRVPAYSSAKAAISNFTQWLAVHFSKQGIRVNAIAPGFFISDQNRALLLNKDGSHTERAEKILKNTPMGRFGVPEELVGTLLWLLDENSSGFVNGAVIPVDGGFSAYSGV
jgi:NAD(P)-dependent dehydrogenase (short-subunit alcohol dehydrogenase family)